MQRRRSETKLILVTRPTRVAELRRRFSTKSQARFYVSRLGQDFSDYEEEDAGYTEAVRATQETLEELGRVQSIDRSFLPNFVFGPGEVVIVLGQDGLVANTVKYLNGQPVVGVNPDPARWDGKLLPFQVGDLNKIVWEVIQGKRPTKAVTMAQATLNTGQTLYAVNDLFIGPRSHGSARYSLQVGSRTENQSSSGVIVSTGLGSTGWFTSLMTGAAAIAAAQLPFFGPPQRLQPAQPMIPAFDFPWDSPQLFFTVREPFPSRTSQVSLVFGRITAKEPLIMVSQMPENGVIFSDGIETDFLEFRSGTRATLGIADKQGRLVV